MDFKQQIDTMELHVKQTYQAYYKKIKIMTSFQNASKLAELEAVCITNYTESLRADLKFQLEEELLELYDYRKIDAMIAPLFPSIKIAPMQIKETDFITKKKRPVTPSGTQSSAKTSGDTQKYYLLAGALVGGAIGAGAGLLWENPVGGAIGGVAVGAGTGALIYHTTAKPKKKTAQTIQVEEEIIFDSTLFQEKMRKREHEVINILREYIANIEDTLVLMG